MIEVKPCLTILTLMVYAVIMNGCMTSKTTEKNGCKEKKTRKAITAVLETRYKSLRSHHDFPLVVSDEVKYRNSSVFYSTK